MNELEEISIDTVRFTETSREYYTINRSSFKSSTSSCFRAARKLSLLSLPSEILYNIFNELKSSNFVFQPICRALLPLYRKFTFRSIRLYSSIQLYEFALALIGNKSLGKYVESFHFDQVKGLEFILENKVMQLKVTEMFKSMKNLISLTIYTPSLFRFFFSINLQFPRLDQLNVLNPFVELPSSSSSHNEWDFYSFRTLLNTQNQITHLGITITEDAIIRANEEASLTKESNLILNKEDIVWENEIDSIGINSITGLDEFEESEEDLSIHYKDVLELEAKEDSDSNEESGDEEETLVQQFSEDDDDDDELYNNDSTLHRYTSLSSNLAKLDFDEAYRILNSSELENVTVGSQDEKKDDSIDDQEINLGLKEELMEQEVKEVESAQECLARSSELNQVEEENDEISRAEENETELISETEEIEVLSLQTSDTGSAITHLDYEGPLDSPGVLDFILSFNTTLLSLSLKDTSTQQNEEHVSYYAYFSSSIQELHIYDSSTLFQIQFDSNFFNNITTLTIDVFDNIKTIVQVIYASISVVTLNLGQTTWFEILCQGGPPFFILPGPTKLLSLKNVNLLLEYENEEDNNVYGNQSTFKIRERRSFEKILEDKRSNFEDYTYFHYYNYGSRLVFIEKYLEAGSEGGVAIGGTAVKAFVILKRLGRLYSKL